MTWLKHNRLTRQLSTVGATAVALMLPYFPAVAAELKVLVAPVISAPIVEKLPLSGTITSPQFSALATRVDGYVEKLLVDVGDSVQAGDPLLELDAKIARLELLRLAAATEEANFLYRNAARLASEAKELVKSKNISQTEYETRIAQAAANKARTAQLSAQREVQQEQLERHTLKAPFAGVIAEKLTEAGQWVRADSAAFRLAQMDPLLIEVRVPERYFGQLHLGSAVELIPNFQADLKINAAVERIVPVSDPGSRTFLARVKITNPDSSLAPGMAVRAEFSLGGVQTAPVLQVPADALVRRTDGSTLVWAVRSSENTSLAQPVTVTVGRSSGDQIEISSDQLKPGDPVVILGNESLRPGQAVTIEKAS
ncbi:MAG: efflux RND transporter periplasmic adaptor subunit [Pseudomonadales bacterium]